MSRDIINIFIKGELYNMEYSKNIVLLCLFDELKNSKKLNPKDIIKKYNINNRQMWRYINNIREYLNAFSFEKLIYDKVKRIYIIK